MKFLKENSLILTALLLSLTIHAGILIFFSKIEEVKFTKKEDKPIIISFVDSKKSSQTTSAKRKIPRKTKVKTPKKTTKPYSQKNAKSEKITQQKQKTITKPEKEIAKKKSESKKEAKKPILKKELISDKQPKKEKIKKESPEPLKKPQKTQPQPEKEIPIKKEAKKLNIASEKTAKEIENKPEVSKPVPENQKIKEEKPPEQLNLSHLEGKDEIFQIGSDDKKENKSPEKDEDIMKYLYGVRDKLQENLAYPLMAKRLEIEGTAIVRFVINPDGSVNEESIKVVKSSGSNILDKQAIITVKNSIPFEPTPNKKKIVVEIPVIFEIIRSY